GRYGWLGALCPSVHTATVSLGATAGRPWARRRRPGAGRLHRASAETPWVSLSALPALPRLVVDGHDQQAPREAAPGRAACGGWHGGPGGTGRQQRHRGTG